MTTGSGIAMKVVGIILVVAGAGLAIWGYQLSGSVESEIAQAVTGADTDKVMTLYIAGAAGIVSGIYLFMKT